jgi:uncharacterized protein YbjT (DUF2867 family)
MVGSGTETRDSTRTSCRSGPRRKRHIAESPGSPQLIAAAKAQGNSRIVFLPTFLASMPALQIGKLHKDKEDAIRDSGLQGRFVRPDFFMTNSRQRIGKIKAEGGVYNARDIGKSAPIALEDIAAVRWRGGLRTTRIEARP